MYPRVRAALCSDKYTADAGVVSIRETQATWGHLSRYDREYIQETRSRNSSLEIFNKYVVRLYVGEREHVEVMKSVSKVVVVERKRICLADSGGLQLLKGDCGGWKEGGERNIFLGEFKEREGGSEAIRFQRKFARG